MDIGYYLHRRPPATLCVVHFDFHNVNLNTDYSHSSKHGRLLPTPSLLPAVRPTPDDTDGTDATDDHRQRRGRRGRRHIWTVRLNLQIRVYLCKSTHYTLVSYNATS